MKRPRLHYLTIVMLSAICLALAVLVNDLRAARDEAQEVAGQLIRDQLATHHALEWLAVAQHQTDRRIERLIDLQDESNRDIDWISDALGDYFTNCDLDWFIERNTE